MVKLIFIVIKLLMLSASGQMKLIRISDNLKYVAET